MEMENYLHPNAIASVCPEAKVLFGDFDDVPLIVAKAIHESSDSDIPWDEVTPKKKSEKSRKAKIWLNQKAVLAMTPDMLNEIDPNGDVVGWFDEISRMIDSTV
jgi:hypothetical protein